MNIYRLVLLAILAWSVGACGDSNTSPSGTTTSPSPSSPVENSQTVTPTIGEAKTRIEQTLLSYYEDLSAERMDEAKYYAPMVTQFFSQNNVPRSEVGANIRKGFDQVENRIIQLDRQSLNVRQEQDQYVVDFGGKLQYRRTSSQENVSEQFRNQVVFNNDFQIVAYKSLESAPQPGSRTLTNVTRSQVEGGLVRMANTIISACKAGDLEKINGFVHPERGLYFITRPGAMDAVYHGSELEELFQKGYSNKLVEVMRGVSCDLQLEELPEFECESFSKEGCFLAKSQAYDQVSFLMKTLNDNELGEFDASQMQSARVVEKDVSYTLVLTEVPIAMHFGKVGEDWYLFVVDIAKYECSA